MRRLVAFVTCLLLVGCSTGASVDVQAAGDRLASELPTLYPGRVVAVSFENAPPLDPPTLFIDLDPAMDSEAQLRLLCDEINPRVKAAGADIDVTVTFGWHSDDCS